VGPARTPPWPPHPHVSACSAFSAVRAFGQRRCDVCCRRPRASHRGVRRGRRDQTRTWPQPGLHHGRPPTRLGVLGALGVQRLLDSSSAAKFQSKSLSPQSAPRTQRSDQYVAPARTPPLSPPPTRLGVLGVLGVQRLLDSSSAAKFHSKSLSPQSAPRTQRSDQYVAPARNPPLSPHPRVSACSAFSAVRAFGQRRCDVCCRRPRASHRGARRGRRDQTSVAPARTPPLAPTHTSRRPRRSEALGQPGGATFGRQTITPGSPGRRAGRSQLGGCHLSGRAR